MPIESPFQNSYCGNGNLKACQQAIWAAISRPPVSSWPRSQGTRPGRVARRAVPERITFTPGLLPFTMRYTNRPTGIQQVISFSGHG